MPVSRFVPLVLAGLCGLPAAEVQAQALPPAVQAAIADSKTDCGEKVSLDKGFLTRRDINGDGVDDIILDYGSFRCGNSVSYYCGTAGCTTQVFASLPGGGYAKVLDDNVRGLDFRTVKGKPTMVLDGHGSGCGKSGAENCRTTLIWNGRTFKRGG